MAFADSCPVTRHVAMQGAAFRHRKRQAGQVSPDKNVNCRYTTAAFTISPESAGLRHVVLTCPDYGLVCRFCSSAHSFALRLPSDPSSRRRPCLRLVLGTPSHDGVWIHVQGTCTPMHGVHSPKDATRPKKLGWRVMWRHVRRMNKIVWITQREYDL